MFFFPGCSCDHISDFLSRLEKLHARHVGVCANEKLCATRYKQHLSFGASSKVFVQIDIGWRPHSRLSNFIGITARRLGRHDRKIQIEVAGVRGNDMYVVPRTGDSQSFWNIANGKRFLSKWK